jgi:hypothetical protein
MQMVGHEAVRKKVKVVGVSGAANLQQDRREQRRITERPAASMNANRQ